MQWSEKEDRNRGWHMVVWRVFSLWDRKRSPEAATRASPMYQELALKKEKFDGRSMTPVSSISAKAAEARTRGWRAAIVRNADTDAMLWLARRGAAARAGATARALAEARALQGAASC